MLAHRRSVWAHFWTQVWRRMPTVTSNQATARKLNVTNIGISASAQPYSSRETLPALQVPVAAAPFRIVAIPAVRLPMAEKTLASDSGRISISFRSDGRHAYAAATQKAPR